MIPPPYIIFISFLFDLDILSSPAILGALVLEVLEHLQGCDRPQVRAWPARYGGGEDLIAGDLHLSRGYVTLNPHLNERVT